MMKFTTVSPDQIDTSNDLFRISFAPDIESLQAAIAKAGLLTPPVLVSRKDRLIIVSGWKRIQACLNLAMPSIPVFLSPETNDLELFKIPVYENASVRDYSPVEKSTVLYKLSRFGEEDKNLIRQFLPLLDIPPTRQHLAVYLTLAQSEPGIKKLIHAKNLPYPVIQILLKYSPQDREILLPLLWPLGQNKQKELLTSLYEFSQKQGISIQEVFASSRIHNTQAQDNLNPRQKADKIHAFLLEKRNPALSSWTKAFEALLKQLNISQGIIVNPSPFFEGEDLSLMFNFKNREEFVEKLSQLKDLASHPNFSALFDPHSDE